MLAVLIAAAALAAPQGFTEAKVLEPAASYVAKKDVAVYCASSAVTWADYVASSHTAQDAHGSTAVGSAAIQLEPIVCATLRGQVRAGGVYVPLLAESIQILTHEAIHARGERDEGVTDCAAMHEMPGVAVRFFRIKAGKQLRAIMAAAWTWHRRASLPYLSVC